MPSMMPMEGSSFRSPYDISGLDGWWEADSITGLADGAAVSPWNDSSYAGVALEQTSAGRTTDLQNQYQKRITYSALRCRQFPSPDFCE